MTDIDAIRARIEAGQGTPEDTATVLAALDAEAAAHAITRDHLEAARVQLHAAEAREARLREALTKAAHMGGCSQTHHDYVIAAARAALASPEAKT
jgi:hypothetical protein